jgi:hypothetical protein
VNNPPFEATFRIDQAPPATTATVSSLPWREDWYRAETITVTLAAADNQYGSGIQVIAYQVDGGNWVSTSTLTVTLALSGEGAHAVAYHAQDVAGNWESVYTQTFQIDLVEPAISGQFPSDGALISDTATTIQVVLSDTLSGIDVLSTTLYLDGLPAGTQPISGTGGVYTYTFFSLGALMQGAHTAYVRAFDRAGNVSEALWRFTVDSHTEIQVLSPLSGAVTNRDTITLTADVETGVVVTATASSAVDSQTYTVTNGRLVVPGWPLAEGPNTITLQATDPAGNVATATLSITYDPDQPAALVYAGETSHSWNPPRYEPHLNVLYPLAFYASAYPLPGGEATGWALQVEKIAGDGSSYAETITGSAPAAQDWMIYWDGGAGAAPEGTYSYQLVVTFTQGVTSQVTASVIGTLQIDRTPPATPEVNLDRSDESNVIWFSHAVALDGQAPGAQSVVLYYEDGSSNRVVAEVSPDGRWVADLPLVSGQTVDLRSRRWTQRATRAGDGRVQGRAGLHRRVHHPARQPVRCTSAGARRCA